jgi:hypothetical protein
MDDFEAVYTLYKDKALNITNTAGNFLTFFTITFLSVFIPLAYTLAGNSSQDMIALFKKFVVFIPMIFLPISVYLVAKYREYKYKYTTTLIKSIVNNDFTSSSSTPNFSYKEVCNKVIYKTGLEYNEVMALLIDVYPPE